MPGAEVSTVGRCSLFIIALDLSFKDVCSPLRFLGLFDADRKLCFHLFERSILTDALRILLGDFLLGSCSSDSFLGILDDLLNLATYLPLKAVFQ